MSEQGYTWPEQDAVEAWLRKYGIKVSFEAALELKTAVTKPRILVQQALEAAQATSLSEADVVLLEGIADTVATMREQRDAAIRDAQMATAKLATAEAWNRQLERILLLTPDEARDQLRGFIERERVAPTQKSISDAGASSIRDAALVIWNVMDDDGRSDDDPDMQQVFAALAACGVRTDVSMASIFEFIRVLAGKA